MSKIIDKEINFVPVLFAGDINVYSMARAFHELYGIKAKAFGKLAVGPCWNSKIMDYQAVSDVDTDQGFMGVVKSVASENKDKKVLLIGCGDSYVQLISQNKDKLPENCIAPYIPIDLMNDLIHKEHFYAMCEKNGVDYPDTFVHKKEMGHDFKLPFGGPYIIKPSNGILYWKHPFPGQDKVFKTQTREGLEKILDDIYGAGYDDSIIIQNFIPGDDTYMRVLTNYSGKDGKVRLTCLGHVLLEEHTPHGIGNHAVIITEVNEDLQNKFRDLLDDMGYVGFSNFDIKYDQRDGKYKVFEINTRQGRSNYYVTGAGANLAQYLVEDWIYDHPIDYRIVDEESLWMVVPKGVAFKHIKPQQCKMEMRDLISRGKVINPLYYSEEKGLVKRLKLFKSQMAHYYKFNKYYK